MKRVVLIFLFISLGIFANAQKDSAAVHIVKNSVFVEYGGNAVQSGISFLNRFSINYERNLFSGSYSKGYARIGYTIPTKNYYASIPYDRSEHIIPVMIELMFGKRYLFFETGVGGDIIFFNSDHKHAYYAFTSVLGLAIQPKRGGLIARVGFTLSLGDHAYPGSSYPYFGNVLGISIGYSF